MRCRIAGCFDLLFHCEHVSIVIQYDMWEVRVTKRALKRIAKAPETVQILFDELVEDLSASGPFRSDWPNYSPLGSETYHCHLNFSWVACWRSAKGAVEIEVYYAGSREDAPY